MEEAHMATGKTKLFSTGIGAPEGPVSLPDGGMYVTEMSARGSASPISTPGDSLPS